MRRKLLNLSLVMASLVGYLEWGQGRSAFLFQAEVELFSKALVQPMSVIHPFTILPVLGQAALVATLFQKEVGRRLTYFGIAGVGALVALIAFIGAITLNPRMLLSSLPFLVIAGVTWREHREAHRPRKRPGAAPEEST